MLGRLLQGVTASVAVAIVPAIGKPTVLAKPQLWLLLVLGVLANLFQPSYKPFDRSAPTLDRGTALQNLWTCGLVQLLAVVEAIYVRYPSSFEWDVVVTVSFSLMVVGLAVRTWAVFTLGRFFTWHVTVQEGQKVIRSGPYRYVRHPSYLGALLAYFFGTTFFHSWASMCLAAIALPAAFFRRIKLEEAVLKRSLGQEYEKYCKEVPALIPVKAYFSCQHVAASDT